MAMAGAHLNQEIESQLPLLIHEEEEETEIKKIPTDDGQNVGGDSWLQVFLVLVTGLNTASVLAYSGSVMVNLGWIVGIVGFITAIALSFDANALLARLHEFGGKRHIRYRDLAGHIYGRKGYFAIWALQYIELFMISIGFVILAGSALKAVFELFGDGVKLSYCNLIAGFSCCVLAISIPHLSALRVWLGLSTVLTVIYITVAIWLSIKDGAKASARDYSVSGTLASKIFKAIGSFSIMAMCSNTGMLPEIQATLRKPVVGNMMKALYLQFTVGLIPMFAVVLIGYWAYGSSTSTYLLDNTTGPTWVKALANISALLQAVISYHIYASPTYEYFDTKYGIEGSALAIRNLSFRTGLRCGYVLVSSLLAALLPFLGDIMTLNGALCLIPLTFVIPHHMCLVAKKNKLPSLQKLWHWLIVCIFSFFCIIAAIAGVRLIIVDSKTYKIFD